VSSISDLQFSLFIDSSIPGVTNNAITSEVASGSCKGLWPKSSVVPVLIEPDAIDSLEPAYSCPNADAIRNNYTTGAGGAVWQGHLNATAALFAKLDSISGIQNPDTAGWHASWDQ
jgi:acid phosphatase